jgi:anti-anti-sigma factor
VTARSRKGNNGVSDQRQAFFVGIDGYAGLGAPVVFVHGELDMATGPELAERLSPIVAGRPETLLIDLTDTTFMDCAGVRVIARARSQLPAGDCRVVLRNPCPIVRKVLALTGLDGSCVIEGGQIEGGQDASGH